MIIIIIIIIMLFRVYVNDLPQSLKKCAVDSYVDDTNVLVR